MEMKVHVHFKFAHVLKFIIFCAMDLLNVRDGVREKGYYCSVGAKEDRSEGDQSGVSGPR